jgi:hypothetical protein
MADDAPERPDQPRASEQRPSDDDVPKLPRGRGLRLSRPQLIRVALTLLLLIFVVMTQRPCADAVSTFVTSFGDRGSGSSVTPGSDHTTPRAAAPAGAVTGSGSTTGSSADTYERLRPGMSEDEIKAAIERARAKVGGSAE